MKAKVLFVAAEALPIAKTGGLADVVTASAQALQARNLDVTVLLPGYREALAQANDLHEVGRLEPAAGLQGGARLLAGTLPDSDVKLVLLDMPQYFDREGSLYLDQHGHEFGDNAQRFAALCSAAVAIAAGGTGLPVPHVVHGHDWHAGLVPWLMKARGLPQPTVMTIHNLAFQGVFDAQVLPSLGIDAGYRHDPALEYWGKISFLKAGLASADRITTVSPHYAEEVLTPRFGHGMDGLLRSRADRLSAVRNGIDTAVWNPSIDPLIARRFDVTDTDAGKAECKRALQQRFGLIEDPEAPLLASGSRMTSQKMLDLALPALTEALTRHPSMQVVILGRGEHALEAGFRALAQAWPGRVGVHIGYDEKLAHGLHAGADMLLHGSRFEPFGLTPVYAMLYGCLPIVSRVGGLIDTVTETRGFLFDGEQAADMLAAIETALATFGDKATWARMRHEGMCCDFGWDEPAADYIGLYRSLHPPIGEALAAIKADGTPLRPRVPAKPAVSNAAISALPRAAAVPRGGFQPRITRQGA